MSDSPKIPPELRETAFPGPGAVAAWRAAKQPALVAGLERASPELRPLQVSAADALSARKKLGLPLGDDAGAKLAALVAIQRDNAVTLAAELASVHGLLPVLEAALSLPEWVCLYQHGKEPLQWLAPVDAPVPPHPVVVLRPSRIPWIDALRGPIDRASASERERARTLAAAARDRSTLGVRVALARAFRDETWADEDAAALAAEPVTEATELAAIVRRLLPYVSTDTAFEALASQATSDLFYSSVYAEILVRAPSGRALQRLVRLLELPLAAEATAHVIKVVEAIAAFDDADAAAAVARAAPFARTAAKGYFAAHPHHRPILAARAEGRGKPAAAVRTIVVELERADAAARDVADPERTLPRCLAEPPWPSRVPPWPARALPPIVDGERLVRTPELDRMQSLLAPKAGGDEAILAGKGLLGSTEFMGLSDQAALANIGRLTTWALPSALARFGERAIEGVAKVLNGKPTPSHKPVIAMIRSPRIAAVVWDYHEDEEWLLSDPSVSALGLIPELFAVQLSRRWSAEMGLMRLVVAGRRAVIEEAAARWNLRPEVAAILDRDPWTRIPDPLPPLHAKVAENALPPLATREGPLPASTTATVARLVAVSPIFLPHPGLFELRAECTEASRSQLAWELSEETGATKAIALLGGDGAVRLLDRQLSAKRPEMKPAERFEALDALAWNGSPLALVLLLKHALASPWQDRTEIIDRHFDEVARRRGCERWEVEDEAFAALAFDDADVSLDYGPRSFGLRLDDHLVPYLVAGDGARIAKLPKPTKKDDAPKAALAKDALDALALDLDDVRVTVFAYLERAMAHGRSWRADRFRRTIVAHPLLGRVARSLVFEMRTADGSRFFRIAEDRTFASSADVGVELPEDADVFVAHPLHLAEPERATFRRLFDDYALFPPFAQLARETFVLTPAERDAATLARLEGRLVATARLGDLLGVRGWQHGSHSNMVKPLGRLEARLQIADRRGGASELQRVSLRARGGAAESAAEVALPFSLLSDVEASELLRDLETLPPPPR